MAVEIVIACESWPPSAAIKGFKYCAALTKGWNIILSFLRAKPQTTNT